MVGLKSLEPPGGEGAPCDLNTICTVGRAASVGTGLGPHMHTHAHGSGPQSAACMRTFLDMNCGLTSPAEMAQEHEGLPQGARGHGGSGRVSDSPGVTQQSQA